MSVEPKSQHDVFISYSSKDKKWADAACAVLERHRIRCWIAPRDIIPGSEWGGSIIAGIDACKVMVLIFSGNANASAQVRREVERAISKGLSVLPCRVENIAPSGAMEYALSNTHWLDAFTPPVERHMEFLANSVKTLLRQPGATPEPIEPAEEPARSEGPRVDARTLAVAAAVLSLVVCSAAVGIMLTRGKPSNPEPPPITRPLDDTSKRQAAQSARDRAKATETSPPAAPTKARLEPEAIAALTRPEPKVVAVVRWLRDDIPGQKESEATYYENGRLSIAGIDATWSQSKGVVKQVVPNAGVVGGTYLGLFWSAADGKSLRGATNLGPTFSGHVIKGSFGDTTPQPMTAVVHWKNDQSARQFVSIYYANGKLDDPDGNATWTLVNGALKLTMPYPGAPGGSWVINARVTPDGTSWHGANQLKEPHTGQVVSGSFLGVTR
jgi:hypothetical protein